MRYVLFSICLIASVLATGAQGRNDAVEREIADVERELNRARFENDVAAVRRLFAAEFYTVTATGAIREIGNKGEGPFNQTQRRRLEEGRTGPTTHSCLRRHCDFNLLPALRVRHARR